MSVLESLQNSLIFLPDKKNYGSPDSCGFDFQEVFIDTPDGEKLHSYFFPSKSKMALIYFHGNAQNLSIWHEAAIEIRKKLDINILISDYRGYGKSSGRPSLEGIIIDGLAIYEWLINKGFDSTNISLYGRSLGGGVALEVANKKEVKSIILACAFTSLSDMAREHYPLIPANFVNNKLLNNKELIQNIKCPVFIVQGDKDNIVFPSHAYNLYEKAYEPKKLLILEGAGHNDLLPYYNDEYYKILKDLIL